jgi:hypothetical protein
MKVV